MDSDSPFAQQPTDPHDGQVHLGPDVTDGQLDAVDAMHDAEDADDVEAIGAAAVEKALRDTVDARGGETPDTPETSETAGGDPVVTYFKCHHCGTKGHYPGAITADMIEHTFTRGVGENGLPICPHCGTATDAEPVLTAPEAIGAAMTELERQDAQRAGNAAKPLVQPSLPGVLPPFDFEKAQRRAEALEAEVASAERLWESAKNEAKECKEAFDDAVKLLRAHIRDSAAARQEAIWQAKKAETDAASGVPAAPPERKPCLYEQTTGQPCHICRSPKVDPAYVADATTIHLANAAFSAANSEAGIGAGELREAIYQVTGLALEHQTVLAWSAPERLAVGGWLGAWASAQTSDLDPRTMDRPAVLGRAHEAGEPDAEHQSCRICGGPLRAFRDGVDRWSIGQAVGTDCPGEPEQELARPTAKRNPKPRKRAK